MTGGSMNQFIPIIAGARHRLRRARRTPRPRILRRQHPQPAHAPGYSRAVSDFLASGAEAGVPSIATVHPLHVAT
jgi:hypothetical protein